MLILIGVFSVDCSFAVVVSYHIIFTQVLLGIDSELPYFFINFVFEPSLCFCLSVFTKNMSLALVHLPLCSLFSKTTYMCL